ncbi:YdaS family helix-turn-helix protein [Pseudomonas aeruginosa]|uniref:YdaS family helix-turn-helix protein n=1 Tax=Pseudomonas aeruginosa TaxID=287 RepID=UPI003D29B63D
MPYSFLQHSPEKRHDSQQKQCARPPRCWAVRAELARKLNVRAPTVSQWCSGVRPIPAKRAVEIEALTAGSGPSK